MSYTPSRGPLAGRPFKSYYAYRNAWAIHAGYENYADSKRQRNLHITELGWNTKPENMTNAEWVAFKARHGH